MSSQYIYFKGSTWETHTKRMNFSPGEEGAGFSLKKVSHSAWGIQRFSPQSWPVVQDVKAPAERAIVPRMCGKLHRWYNVPAGHNAEVLR